ncbi:phosphate ABC transporter substrate-binding protein [Aromatoleum petrolei]|uniref:Solute-binding protein n=1 Tax=Aromatoleum petrolei TaxID=76116 RepID=A0ABX1MTB7_9RHOO|nr:phosphate ABC transporter substrate-binding protein [Aromatoleum petrolei]NMF91223.1 solute-binding protein [Aromatoleum petrolei]
MAARAVGRGSVVTGGRPFADGGAGLRLGVLLALFAIGPALSATPSKPDSKAEQGSRNALVIAGSGTMSPLVKAIADRFRERRPDVVIKVRPLGSDRGLQALRDAQADIAMLSRSLPEGETDLVGVPIARDGVSLVVHRDNSVRNLRSAEIASIYGGRIHNWRAVGGEDRPIRVLAAEQGRSSSELFARHFDIDYAAVPAANILTDNLQRLQAVAGDRSAIVFMSVGEAERAVEAGQPIRLLSVDGIEASSRSVRKGWFPVARPLTLVTRGLPQGLAREFIEFAMSSNVTGLIRQLDFVPYVD